jgi:hypothetical protein
MPRFRVFHPLWMAFYSIALYRDVGRSWTGLGVPYLLLLLCVTWLPSTLKMHAGFGEWLRAAGREATRNLPTIHIEDGEVRTEPPGRRVLVDPDSGKPFVLVELDASLDEIQSYEEDLVVLTRHGLVVRRPSRGQTRTFDLSGVTRFSMTPQDAERWLGLAARVVGFVLFVPLVLASLVYRLGQAFFYGGIGTLLARMAGAKLGYETLVRLAAVAITPAVWLDTAHDLADAKLPLWWLVCFGVAMGYLYFAIRANGPEPTALPAHGVPPPAFGS